MREADTQVKQCHRQCLGQYQQYCLDFRFSCVQLVKCTFFPPLNKAVKPSPWIVRYRIASWIFYDCGLQEMYLNIWCFWVNLAGRAKPMPVIYNSLFSFGEQVFVIPGTMAPVVNIRTEAPVGVKYITVVIACWNKPLSQPRFKKCGTRWL